MKLKTINPDKYNVLSKTDLKDQLLRRDMRDSQDKLDAKQSESRLLRMGSAAGASLLTGILYQKKPSLESLMGTPVSLDHLLALGGSVGAFLSDDDDVAQAAEGIANAGLVPLMRKAGRKIGGLSLGS
ncbi:MAG: hypothetical protein AB1Z98_18785 [Nannocystaceae bacterium]